MTATIGATHVLCSIGNGTDQVWASTRAGIGGISDSEFMDREFEAIKMGLVPEDALGKLAPAIDKLPLPPRARRMLRLAQASFQFVARDLQQPVPLFIGLPEFGADEAPWLPHLPAYLQILSGIHVDQQRSMLVPRGRAAALIALARALDLLQADPSLDVVVGGFDSYFDLGLLGGLVEERRISGSSVMDGFIPGEGAAFYVLSGAHAPGRRTDGVRVVVNGAASAMDPGHRYGDAPARGEGLAVALAALRQQMGPLPSPIATTFAGFNGENFDARLWGVARLRHSGFFSANMVMEHPADKFGDTGAATGAILMALAARALSSGTRSGPALVWAASDREPRGCAVLSVT